MQGTIRTNLKFNGYVHWILGEEMEFVEVGQDEMPGNTWDSFESSEFYNNLDDGAQEHFDAAAATSTTKTVKSTPINGSFWNFFPFVMCSHILHAQKKLILFLLFQRNTLLNRIYSVTLLMMMQMRAAVLPKVMN